MARQFYLSINTRPREALRVMDQITKDLGRYRGEQRGAWLLAAGMGIAGLAFWIVDRTMGYSGSTFAFVAYLLWGGAALLMGYTLVVLLIRWPHILPDIGMHILVAFAILMMVFLPAWFDGFRGLALLIWVGIVAVILVFYLVVIVIYVSEKATRLPPDQIETARQILHTLRDDVARSGRVTGWPDPTGPQPPPNPLPTARPGSGTVKYYYHDPWLSAKIKLVDGNLLRLTLIERAKVKKGVAERRYQLKVKLVVNPQVYEIISGPQMTGLTHSGTILQLQHDRRSSFRALEVLSPLKTIYGYLRPRRPLVPGA